MKLPFPIILLIFLSSSFTTTVTRESGSENDEEEYKLLCYYGSWSHWNTLKEGRLSPESIDPFLCTHIIYAFAVLSPQQRIVPNDPYLDLPEGVGGYEKVRGLKKRNPSLKVLISIGGWNEGSGKYSNMSSGFDSRRVFVVSVLEFLSKHGFDGIDIDWEYPSQRGGRREDKENFMRLLEELRRELKPKGYLLTVAVGSTKFIADKSYDIPLLNQMVDFVNVMTYDFYGPWLKIAGHHSPLYTTKGDQRELSVASSIHFWLKSGISRNKLVMGIPTYARTFTMARNVIDDQELHPLSRGPGAPGPITKGDKGTLSLPEVCLVLKEPGTRKFWNNDWRAPFLIHGDQWIGYENVSSVNFKTEFVKEMKLAGAMIWAINLDDVTGSCDGHSRMPLSYTISDALRIRPVKLPRELLVLPRDPLTLPQKPSILPQKPSILPQKPSILPRKPLIELAVSSCWNCRKNKLLVFLTVINSSYKFLR